MPTVYKRKADRNRRDARWMIAWTDETGRRRTRKAYTDKVLSEKLARRLEDDARARREGTIDAGAERMAQHATRPIAEHVAEYRRYLEAKANSPEHVDLTVARLDLAIANCKWEMIADIDASSLDGHVERLHGQKRSRATINHHLRSVKSFSRWLFTNHRLPRDPLVGVRLLNAKTDRRRERRALDDDELAKLIRAADERDVVTIEKRYIRKKGPNKGKLRIGTRNLSIPNRGELYLLAVSTGLRLGELRSLTKRSFDLDADPPTVTVEAAYSKRRRRDVQPMRRDIAEAMHPLVESTPKGEHIWPGVPREMGKVIAKDLDAAGIDMSDGDGRIVDFHALRHTFITRMARSGVTPKVAQALARHSTITLTMDRYAHVALADTSRALAALPSIPTVDETPAEIEYEHVAATGTDGPIGASGQAGATDATRANVVARGGKQKQRSEQRAGTTPGHLMPSPVPNQPRPKRPTATHSDRRNSRTERDFVAPCQPVSSQVSGESSSEADGTRTRNHRIDSPVL